MIKVLIAALLGTVVGIVVMVVVIVASGSTTDNSSSIGLSVSLSTAAVSSPASTPASTPTSTPPTSGGGGSTGGSGGPGNAAAGKAVFASNGCGSCHTLAVAGATGTIGPDLGKIARRRHQGGHAAPGLRPAVDHRPGRVHRLRRPVGDARCRQTFGSSLSSSQIADLVALIVSGQQ